MSSWGHASVYTMTAIDGTNCRSGRGNNQSNRGDDARMKKQRQLSGYESPAAEDEDEDETFVTLQRLLRALDGTRQPSSPILGPSGSNLSSATNPRPSQEEMLESRRQERERFRHMLLSKSARRRCPTYYYCEDDEDDDEPPVSAESAISNRVISGSFSRLHVRVISRERWSSEEVERLPIVLLPKDGRVVSPEENPKLKVHMTQEHIALRDQLLEKLEQLPELADHSRLLTPPLSTWHIQMRGIEGV